MVTVNEMFYVTGVPLVLPLLKSSVVILSDVVRDKAELVYLAW